MSARPRFWLGADEPESPPHGDHAERVTVGFGESEAGSEEESESLPATLPVLPLKNTVLFPFLLSPLLVNTERSKRVIEFSSEAASSDITLTEAGRQSSACSVA